ncbi:MAG: hypothetical protein AAF368_05915, partial [Planctomycetota bacterium]
MPHSSLLLVSLEASLSLTASPVFAQCTADAFEPNDSQANATDLGLDATSGTASLTFDASLPALEEDFYKLTLPPWTWLTVGVSETEFSTQELRATLLDSSGSIVGVMDSVSLFIGYGFDLNEVLYQGNSTDQPIELTLRVGPSSTVPASSCHSYRLSFNVIPQPCQFQAPLDSFEINDSCQESYSTLDDGYYSGLFASVLRPDWYEVELDPGERLNLSLIFNTSLLLT